MAKARRKIKWGIGLAIFLLLIYGGLRRFEYTQVYHPTKRMIPWNVGKEVVRQEINFTTSDGIKLGGWFFPAATNSPRKQTAILVCHGNGGNISYLERLYLRLAGTGANVLVFDYRGYGNSEGRPGEEGTYRDAQAAYQWLRQAGFGATNIFDYGESLGGGVATELALREPAGGLVVESAATSIPDMGRLLFPRLPVRLISTIKYDTRQKLARVKVPVLIMHSREDGLIPYRMGQENLAVANEPKMFWEITGRHAAAPEEIHAGMEKYLSALEAARQQGREVKF